MSYTPCNCRKTECGGEYRRRPWRKGKQDGYIEGAGYLISWCVGHLIGLAEAAAYGEQYKKWSYDSFTHSAAGMEIHRCKGQGQAVQNP